MLAYWMFHDIIAKQARSVLRRNDVIMFHPAPGQVGRLGAEVEGRVGVLLSLLKRGRRGGDGGVDGGARRLRHLVQHVARQELVETGDS